MADASGNQAQGNIESMDDFQSGKAGEWERWQSEFLAANNADKKWRKQGNRTVQRYLGGKHKTADTNTGIILNLFWSNITTVKAMMFGKLPEISFSRTNTDFNDDAARVAGMMLERMLNADIGTPNDQYSESLKQNLEDRLLPGLGVSRVRYEYDEEEIEIAAVLDQQTGVELQAATTQTQITGERAPLDYVHWRDFAWSPARTWAEVRWVAFRTRLTRKELVDRFGEDLGNKIPLNAKDPKADEAESSDRENPKNDAWARAEVWEIWCKDDYTAYWWNEDLKTILDKKEDPLNLEGFFPIPEPMASNVTTTAYMPVPDFVMAQDLYNEVDHLETRIAKITDAIKVVGVYDQAAEGVKRMLTEGAENDLIPVDNWAMFAEKGGIQGTVDWMPIQEIAETMNQLVIRRDDAKALLYEISGISDIMRGAQKQAGGPVSATERSLEARFASVRIQALQDEFAKYATDLIRLRAEVVSKHFQPQSIAKQSNIEHTADAQLAPQAIELIKNSTDLIWRLEVKPESVAMVDYAQLKDERSAYITALATFMQSAAPLVQLDPGATPVLLEMLKWGLAGFKGSNEVEGILDQAINRLQQQQGQQGQGQDKPSPEEIKAQMEQQKQQFEMQKQQAIMQQEQQKQAHDERMLQLESQAKQAEIQMSTEQDLIKERAQAEFNMEEERNTTVEFIKREQARARLNNTGESDDDDD
jgi:hypothetical protein